MTTLELVAVGVVVFGALVGMKLGALKQLTRLVAWVAAGVVPYFAAAPVARALEKPLEVPYTISYLFSGLALSLLTYTGVAVALWAFTRDTRKKAEDTGSPAWLADKSFGGLFGAAKATLVAWMALSAFVLVSGSLHRSPGARGESGLLDFVQRHDFWELAFKSRIERLEKVVREATRANPGERAGRAVKSIRQDPRVVAIANDARLRLALEKGDLATVLRSPNVLSLVTDPGALEKLAGEAQAAALENATARTHR